MAMRLIARRAIWNNPMIRPRCNMSAKRRMSTAPASTPPPKSAYELEDVPLFSLRTRIIIYTVVGSVVAYSGASYWLALDRENAYWAQDKFPWIIANFGATLGLPMDPETGLIDRSILGPRDVRDLVGERVNIEAQLKNGLKFTVEADSLEPLMQVMNRTLSGGIQSVVPDSIKVVK